MKRASLSLALLLSLLLSGCSGGAVTALKSQSSLPPVQAVRDEAFDLALGDFGLELLRQVRKEGKNTLLSPLSALLCLSMCANGAQGDTLEQFQTVLCGGGSLEALNGSCRSLLETCHALEAGNASLSERYGVTPGESALSIANSLWLDPRVRVEDGFTGRCTGSYEAGLFAADFTQDAARREVNRWIETHTGGHIKNALAELDPDTILALVNAVYFEGKWTQSFDPEDTREAQTFYLEDGSSGQVDLMNSCGRTDLCVTTQAEQGVLLPYKDGRLAFLALLPQAGTSLTEYLETLDGQRLTELIRGAEETHFTLLLPKFTAAWRGSLAESLQAMGLELAFDPDRADFSPMGTDENGNLLYLTAVEHGAGIEVDEQGTRAFSFTFAGMNSAGAAPLEVLRFDRPFVYGIVDLDRGIPLFLGTFETP